MKYGSRDNLVVTGFKSLADAKTVAKTMRGSPSVRNVEANIDTVTINTR